MATSTKAVLALALYEYKQLLDKYAILLQRVDDTEEEEDKRLVSLLLRERRMGNRRTLWELMLTMNPDTFAKHFRITKSQFEYLVRSLRDNGLGEEHNQGLPPVPTTKKVLMFLWYMANQNSFREMSEKFDVSQSTAHRAVLQVLDIICTMGTLFISWPNASEKESSAVGFRCLCGLTGVIGAIDGCHIRIQRPQIRGGDYMNHKSFYSVLLQGIVDENMRFIDIFVGPPGKVHDAMMLRSSDFHAAWQEKMGDYRLLGDSAYIGEGFPFIITPISDNGILTEDDETQNSRVSCGRAVVEQAFGRIKCKWRRLRDLQNNRIDTVVKIVMAACFLHNLSITSEVCEEHPNGCPRQDDGNK